MVLFWLHAYLSIMLESLFMSQRENTIDSVSKFAILNRFKIALNLCERLYDHPE